MSNESGRLTFKDLKVGAMFRRANIGTKTVWKKVDPVLFPPPAKHVHYNAVSADGSRTDNMGHSTVVIVVEQ